MINHDSSFVFTSQNSDSEAAAHVAPQTLAVQELNEIFIQEEVLDELESVDVADPVIANFSHHYLKRGIWPSFKKALLR